MLEVSIAIRYTLNFHLQTLRLQPQLRTSLKEIASRPAHPNASVRKDGKGGYYQ